MCVVDVCLHLESQVIVLNHYRVLIAVVSHSDTKQVCCWFLIGRKHLDDSPITIFSASSFDTTK